MPRRYITADEQRQVIERANRRCEYCKSAMDYAAQSCVMEHIIPIAAGGEIALDNLALACGGCNEHKHIKLTRFEPVSQTKVPLFHPRCQIWDEHFAWSADFLQVVGLTPAGRATVNVLG
jgi:5-methylcytosine-specific restriction endonuclease McrA